MGPSSARPWLIILMISDIAVAKVELWKCIDDTTIAKPNYR